MSNNKKVADHEFILDFMKNNLTSVMKQNMLLKLKVHDQDLKQDLQKQNLYLHEIEKLLSQMENI